MKDNDLIVGNIQKNCFYDGPGIRTTVFLKGCSIRCPWCSNPENLKQSIQYTCDRDKCNYDNCPFKYDCNGYKSSQEKLKKHMKLCPLSAIKATGKTMSKEELFNKIVKENNNVTFSGGEVLLQSESLKSLFEKLKNNNINICIETSLFSPQKNLLSLIDYVDIFIVDLKILDKKLCSKILHGNIEQYILNVQELFNKNKKVIFRIPVADGYVYNEKNIELIIGFLNKYRPEKVELFKIHNLGRKKYEALNMEYTDFIPISNEKIMNLKNQIEKMNMNVEIIKF